MSRQIAKTTSNNREQEYQFIYNGKQIATFCEIQTKKGISEINFFLDIDKEIFYLTDDIKKDLIQNYKKNLFGIQLKINEKIDKDCKKLSTMNLRNSFQNIKSDFVNVFNKKGGFHLLQNFRKREISTYCENAHVASTFLDIDSDSRVILNPSIIKRNTNKEKNLELCSNQNFIYQLHLIHVKFSNTVISSKIIKLLYLLRKIVFFAALPLSFLPGIVMGVAYVMMPDQPAGLIVLEIIASLGMPVLMAKYGGNWIFKLVMTYFLKKII